MHNEVETCTEILPIGSSLSVSELEYFLSVENVELSLYAQDRQSLLLLTQGNIYNRLWFLNKYFVPRGIKRAISRKLVKISDCRVS